jgi:hypothetical protein
MAVSQEASPPRIDLGDSASYQRSVVRSSSRQPETRLVTRTNSRMSAADSSRHLFVTEDKILQNLYRIHVISST